MASAAAAPTGQNTLITTLLELSCSGLLSEDLWQTVPASLVMISAVFWLLT